MSTALPSTSEAVARELGRDRLLEIWRFLLLNRLLEERLRNLYRQGKIVGGLFRSLGQEGISVGSAYALDRRKGDILAPMIRNLGSILVFGSEPREIFAQYMARASSPTGGKDNVVHYGTPDRGFIGPISQLGTLISVLAGMALAGRMQGKELVTMTYVGDGATSTGDFHEGLNFAAVTQAPFILIIENNGYAYSTPTSLQTALTDLADKAAAYGIPGVIVDGNDVLAVFDATRQAAARARSGSGPTLIEAKTYRMVGHAEHDGTTYVPPSFFEEGRARDPLMRYRRLLLDAGYTTETDLAPFETEITAQLDDAISFAENSPLPEGPEALTGVYAES